MSTTNQSKQIKYLGRDFDTLKQGLVEFAKNYYPNTYNDFNEASPGMMFVEMAAYVGDVLNYYIDAQFKESLLLHATERRNVLAIAAALGYKPKLSVPAMVDLDVFQLVPASGSGASVAPDTRYCVKIAPGLAVRSTSNGTEFLVNDPIDFSLNNLHSPTTYTVYSLDSNGAPNYFLAKKVVRAISARKQTIQVPITGVNKFYKFQITDDNLIDIDSIVDSEGNNWYNVPYLAQDTIFERVENTAYNDPDASVFSEETPYLLKLKKVPRRFITRTTEDGLEIQFGAGISVSADEELLATPENIGLTLPTGKIDLDQSIDPQAPVFTSAYGIAPSNTTLTVTYLVGGGVASNVASNTLTEIVGMDTTQSNLPAATGELNSIIVNSIAVNNPIAATGGRSEETIEEVRHNALAQLTSQNRAVTREDYIMRAYAMPGVFGSVSKAYILPDEQANVGTSENRDTIANPLALNLYTLGYDSNRKLTTVNRAVKENLKTYLSQYKMLTDSINLRDAFIINIQVNFDIVSLPNYNGNQVLAQCIKVLKDYFSIDRWQINQPIMLASLYGILNDVPGVQAVTGLQVKNLHDSTLGYSNVAYSIAEATKGGIIYPSVDPCIFEVKYPDNDIKGRLVTF